jgi:hypothetical protein
MVEKPKKLFELIGHLSPHRVAQSVGDNEALAPFDQFAPVNTHLLCGCHSVVNPLTVNLNNLGQGFLPF